MAHDDITILVQDANLNLVADPVDNWSNVDVTLKDNDVGSGQFTAPADWRLMEAVTTPGNRVSVIRRGEVFASGPIEKPGAYAWSHETGDTVDPGQVTVTFADNNVYLAWRLSYPDPAVDAGGAQPDAYICTSMAAETIIGNLVNLNAGPGALAYRRIPRLVMGTVTGATPAIAVNISSRFEPLTDVLRSVALFGGQLSWRVYEAPGKQLVFECYQPVDRSPAVRFSRQLGNLLALSTDPSAPTVTAAIVQGTGSGATKVIGEYTPATASPWGRIEKWANDPAGGTDLTKLGQSGANALAEGAEKVNLTATAIDNEFVRYGRDYKLGDTVSVELIPGLLVSDRVTSVHLTAKPDDMDTVAPVIGSDTGHNDTKTINLVRELERRVGLLERS